MQPRRAPTWTSRRVSFAAMAKAFSSISLRGAAWHRGEEEAPREREEHRAAADRTRPRKVLREAAHAGPVEPVFEGAIRRCLGSVPSGRVATCGAIAPAP